MSDKPASPAPRKVQRAKSKKSTAIVPAKRAAPAVSAGPDSIRTVARNHPFALLAGGLAVGVLVGALLPRRQTSRLSGPVLAALGTASELGLAYAQKALSRAADTAGQAAAGSSRLLNEAGTRSEDLVEATTSKASELAGDLAGRAAALAEATPARVRESGQRLARGVVRLTSQLRH